VNTAINLRVLQDLEKFLSGWETRRLIEKDPAHWHCFLYSRNCYAHRWTERMNSPGMRVLLCRDSQKVDLSTSFSYVEMCFGPAHGVGSKVTFICRLVAPVTSDVLCRGMPAYLAVVDPLS
jgi:hypothetical protein